VLATRPRQRHEKLDVDLDPVAGQRLLDRFQAVMWRLKRCEAGSRLILRRFNTRHTPQVLMVMS
jgi:hypothetical protein